MNGLPSQSSVNDFYIISIPHLKNTKRKYHYIPSISYAQIDRLERIKKTRVIDFNALNQPILLVYQVRRLVESAHASCRIILHFTFIFSILI